jgi:hypothetical protein
MVMILDLNNDFSVGPVRREHRVGWICSLRFLSEI